MNPTPHHTLTRRLLLALTHGFCCLNVTSNTIPCAGLDLQPALLGARGVELLIAALHRNDVGVPEHPSTTTISALWVEGPTLPPGPVKA